MCIYFTNFNKVFLKDNFPLPKINRLMDFMIWFEFLSSLDTKSSYQ
jgi:hypothetical protein